MAILYGFTGGAQRDLPEDAEVNEENLRATACREASPAASRPRSPRAISSRAASRRTSSSAGSARMGVRST